MNKKIHNIMACVDFSEYSLLVLEYAAELAMDSDILVYNVINQRDVYSIGTTGLYLPCPTLVEEDVQAMENDRQEKITALIKEHFPDDASRMRIKIDIGIPVEKILKTIETDKIDLVVMANKGRGDISRFLFGSTAEKVFRHASVPIVSVRDPKKFKRE